MLSVRESAQLEKYNFLIVRVDFHTTIVETPGQYISSPALAFPTFSEEIAIMIMLKIAAAVVGAVTAGALLVTFAPGFSADFALAVIACFS